MNIVDLKDIIQKNIKTEQIGNKAYNLARLSEERISIIEGFVIGIDCFHACIDYNNAQNFYISVNDNNSASQFREMIKNFQLPDDLEKSMKENIDKIGYPVIVRSSSTIEDSENSSMAGMFLSVGNVSNYEAFKLALLDVWSSAYYNCFDQHKPIGVIVQKYVKAEVGGVIFSRHPLGKDCYYGEYSLSGAENVVEGKDNISIELTYEGKLIDPDVHIGAYVNKLTQAVKDIQGIFECGVDIEWLVVNNHLWILQARPITSHVHKKVIRDFCIIDVDDNETLESIDMSSFYHRYMKWYDKRAMLRKLCKDNNVNIPIVKYVFYNNNNLEFSNIEEVFERTNIIKIESNEKIRTRQKQDVEKYLREIALESDDPITTVRLQEITETEYCGNSCVTEDGKIYIECMPGGFGGFLTGELDFSRYILNKEGQVLDSKILDYDYIWKMNDNTKRFEKTHLPQPIQGVLSKQLLMEIVDMTVKLNRVCNNVKIEFEAAGNHAYFNDATLENKFINSEAALYRVLAPGDFDGEIDILSDKELVEIKEQLGGRSVIAESEFLKKSQDYIWNRGVSNARKILVAPYPDPCLSIFVTYYDGFIFAKGGLLSHLAIILRECKKPALIKNDIYNLKEGTMVKVRNGEFSIVQ